MGEGPRFRPVPVNGNMASVEPAVRDEAVRATLPRHMQVRRAAPAASPAVVPHTAQHPSARKIQFGVTSSWLPGTGLPGFQTKLV